MRFPPGHPFRQLRETGRLLIWLGVVVLAGLIASGLYLPISLEGFLSSPVLLLVAAAGAAVAAMLIGFGAAVYKGQAYGITGGLVVMGVILVLALLDTAGVAMLAAVKFDSWSTDPAMWALRVAGIGIVVWVIVRLSRAYRAAHALRHGHAPLVASPRGAGGVPAVQRPGAQQALTMAPPPPSRR